MGLCHTVDESQKHANGCMADLCSVRDEFNFACGRCEDTVKGKCWREWGGEKRRDGKGGERVKWKARKGIMYDWEWKKWRKR